MEISSLQHAQVNDGSSDDQFGEQTVIKIRKDSLLSLCVSGLMPSPKCAETGEVEALVCLACKRLGCILSPHPLKDHHPHLNNPIIG